MGSGADLFVVCKHCGSEVSPYVTECPYCGNRLRRRAPKLPRPDSRSMRLSRVRARSWSTTRPWATVALVTASCAMWIVVHAEPLIYYHAAILGPLAGQWWRLLTAPFVYSNGGYAFVAIVACAIFGTLLERRRGPIVVLVLFFAAAVAGELVELAAYSLPIASGANGAALALLAAYAAPELLAARSGALYEADLIGTGVIAILLLAIPAVVSEASWVGGATGLVLGAPVGVGLNAAART